MWQQLVMNGVIAGSTYGLVALGFSMIYSVGRFFHFAHAAVIVCAGYSVLFLTARLHFPLIVAFICAVMISAMLGAAMEMGIYRRLRTKKASRSILLLASLGVYIVIQNAISLTFGDDLYSLVSADFKRPILVYDSRITSLQIVILIVNALLYALVGVVVLKTEAGRIVRSVASDPELALILGINTDRVILLVFALGSALAGVAGVLIACDINLTPTMGFNALLMGVVAAVVGGIGKLRGAIIGGLLIGLVQQLGVWKIATQWQDAIVFGVLVTFLLVRPEGLFGKPLRQTTV